MVGSVDDSSPTARALLVLEMLQNTPGIRAQQVADRLGLSDRAVRRYVAVLREAGIPVESTRGRYGGYRIGRGLRVPPLMFTETEALGLVMAVLEGHGAADPQDPVGSALGKIVRVLPEALARPVDAVRRVTARGWHVGVPQIDLTAALVQASATRHRVRLGYRFEPDHDSEMDVDPWAVVVRHRRWYLLCWSHSRDALRVLRVDRVTRVDELAATFTPPEDLDAVRMIEEHLSQGWRYQVEVEIDAAVDDVKDWIPRTLGRLEPLGRARCRLVATTDEPDWYAAQLTALRASFRLVGSPEVAAAVAALSRRLQRAVPTQAKGR
ncbi:MAG: WYL domain-containing protein [Nocardioides sp.]